MRILLFAWSPEPIQLQVSEGEVHLPHDLIPLGAVSLRDTLRPEARETLARFTEVGVQVKVISGDHPQTVAALVRQVGLAPDIKVISGAELETLDEMQLAEVAQEVTVFGRITPQQKERLVLVTLLLIPIAPLRTFFNLQALDVFDYLIIGSATVLWEVLVQTIWHFHLFEDFLQLEWKDSSN